MNKNENYIMLHGKKIPLTDEQIKMIQSDFPEKSPFGRAEYNELYWYVGADSNVYRADEVESPVDYNRFKLANYCTDKDIMKQHALHMNLNNLMWRYSMTHGGDSINWDDCSEIKVNIYYNAETDEFRCAEYSVTKYFGVVPFVNEETARAAIEEIVKPFIAEHPDFDLTKM